MDEMDDIEPVNVVYCYNRTSSEDQGFRDELDKRISKINNVITSDYDGGVGGRWANIITALSHADLILLLESADFQYMRDYEEVLEIAHKRYEGREVYIARVLLRDITVDDKYMILPRDGRAIKSWFHQIDEALVKVKEEVLDIVTIISTNRERASCLRKALQLFNDEMYDDALNEYKSALNLFPFDSLADRVSLDNRASLDKSKAYIWRQIATIYARRARQQDALSAYRNVVRYEPGDIETYVAMANLHMQSLDLTHAIDTYTLAIASNRTVPQLYIEKSLLLLREENVDSALAVCDQAISACSDKAMLRRRKGNILYSCGRYADACETYEAVLADDPDNTYLYSEYGDALFADKKILKALKFYQSAIEAYDRKGVNNQIYREKLVQKYKDMLDGWNQEKKTQELRSETQTLKQSL